MIVAGIDEAGYGPTLGPLVISVSVFRVPDEVFRQYAADLWTVLEAAVSRKPDGHRVAVDDSKKLFHQKQKKGLRDLEEGIYPFLTLNGGSLPRDLRALLEQIAGTKTPRARTRRESAAAYLEAYPWYRGRNVDLPVDTFPNVIDIRAGRLREALAARGVDFIGLATRPVEVLDFNRQIEVHHNKARISFKVIGSFLRRLWSGFPSESVEVLVDRQGGRHHYGPLLFEEVRPRSIRIESQDEERSVYHLTRPRPSGRVARCPDPPLFRVTFGVDSESLALPVALGSMVSKYVREVHMILFNRFWKEALEDLRPTAGYATDARRFLRDIGLVRGKLGIEDGILIRRR